MMMRLRCAVLAAVILLLTGCGAWQRKPTDPLEFGTVWLDAVIHHDAWGSGNCDRVIDWMTDRAKRINGETCEEVFAYIKLPADTDIDDGNCALGHPVQPGWYRVECFADVRINFSGSSDDFMIESVGLEGGSGG